MKVRDSSDHFTNKTPRDSVQIKGNYVDIAHCYSREYRLGVGTIPITYLEVYSDVPYAEFVMPSFSTVVRFNRISENETLAEWYVHWSASTPKVFRDLIAKCPIDEPWGEQVKDGKMDGLATQWYENGQKKAESNWADGKAEGLTTRWYENGQKKAESNWADGELEGLTTRWYENGQMEEEVNWKNNKQDGLAIFWDKNGHKKAESDWKDGKQDGLTTIWHEDGKKRSEIIYKNGEEVSRKDF